MYEVNEEEAQSALIKSQEEKSYAKDLDLLNTHFSDGFKKNDNEIWISFKVLVNMDNKDMSIVKVKTHTGIWVDKTLNISNFGELIDAKLSLGAKYDAWSQVSYGLYILQGKIKNNDPALAKRYEDIRKQTMPQDKTYINVYIVDSNIEGIKGKVFKYKIQNSLETFMNNVDKRGKLKYNYLELNAPVIHQKITYIDQRQRSFMYEIDDDYNKKTFKEILADNGQTFKDINTFDISEYLNYKKIYNVEDLDEYIEKEKSIIIKWANKNISEAITDLNIDWLTYKQDLTNKIDIKKSDKLSDDEDVDVDEMLKKIEGDDDKKFTIDKSDEKEFEQLLSDRKEKKSIESEKSKAEPINKVKQDEKDEKVKKENNLEELSDEETESISDIVSDDNWANFFEDEEEK